MQEGIWAQEKACLVSRERDQEEGAEGGISPCPPASSGSHIGCEQEEGCHLQRQGKGERVAGCLSCAVVSGSPYLALIASLSSSPGIISSGLQDGHPVPFTFPLGIAWNVSTPRLVVVFLS